MASKKKNQAELNAEIDKMVRNAGQSVNSTGNSLSNKYNSTSKYPGQNHVKITMGVERP